MEIEYQDEGSATMLEHVKAAVNRLIEDKGKHGLVRIFFADWNDALNITTDPDAESVMLSEQFCYALKELSALIRRLGDNVYAKYLDEQYHILRQAINETAWDGNWYMRALSKRRISAPKTARGVKSILTHNRGLYLPRFPMKRSCPRCWSPWTAWSMILASRSICLPIRNILPM
ncbi:hypothetical protein HMSSN036_30280 [Paenibacillus macerans]|nr:hypothetical protein HMSSN036_30280 [Paenibacillus macerans]